MENYTASSTLSKQEADIPKKKVEKVVTGTVKIRKKSLFSKIWHSMVQGDMNSIARYIYEDVLIPTFKKSVQDSVDILLYGEGGKSKRGPSSRISYNSIYDDRRSSKREPRFSPGYDFDEIILETRGEAEEILAKLDEIIDAYGVATVLDFYDMLELTGRHTDNKYGWTDLKSAKVDRVRGGFVIRFPRALPID